ncbi:MAG: NAD(P)H-dependent oxidoreductase subunit E [Planctomycetia bacterium]|nr:NAD(P)H-dependent oxidoreductase subunit E [Planctomycetia bacterium]
MSNEIELNTTDADLDPQKVEQITGELISEFGSDPESLIPILQRIQKMYRWLPEPILRNICEKTRITPSDLMGVATFYSQFRLHPVGKHTISICTGTACHVKGASLVLDAFRKELNIGNESDTDAQGLFTLEEIACLGCCTLAPVIRIDGITYGHVAPADVREILDDFLARSQNADHQGSSHYVPDQYLGEIRIGLGSCCQAQGSKQVLDTARNYLEVNGLPVRVKPVGCVGMCHQVPLLEVISPEGKSRFFAKVAPEDVESILKKEYRPKGWIRRIRESILSFLESLWSSEENDPVKEKTLDFHKEPVCSFLGHQVCIATKTGGTASPLDLSEYRKWGGFQGFQKILTEKDPEYVLKELEIAGLRGRGGAGFPTFRKWTAVREAEGSQKYVICNGDEGDPGAFMDRMLLESFPFKILEGMMIAARTVGADRGFLYIRAEYPLAVQRVQKAIDILNQEGLLGDHILGTDFSFHVQIKEGAGAFVCGEETALLESIEGRRGMPRLRPPFPAQAGLYGSPTLVNNVETWSMIPWIFQNSGSAFAQYGTEKSKGTKVFALAGKIRRGGLIEVPMGIPIRTIVEEIGGGVINDGQFKAVQIGGPSGGCVPARLGDTSVDFESLAAVGAIMGSGGLVVLDQNDCMVDIARYFLQFTQEQSCGKCSFCRIGTRRMLEILNRICSGKGKKSAQGKGNGDLENLESLALSVHEGSLCGLGKTAPNPVLSTLRYFREEYEAHLNGCCPSGKCRDLIEYRIGDECNGCTICSEICPTGAIEFKPYRKQTIESDRCTKCDSCRTACPRNAIHVWSGFEKDILVK